jgi:hypothetical protein
MSIARSSRPLRSMTIGINGMGISPRMSGGQLGCSRLGEALFGRYSDSLSGFQISDHRLKI